MNSAAAMEITLNGELRRVQSVCTIADLLTQLNISSRHVAVEVNLQIVPRLRHAEYGLSAGDKVEVVTLVGGG